MAGKSNKKVPIPKATATVQDVDSDEDEEIDTLPVKSSFQAKFSMFVSDDDGDEKNDDDDDKDDEVSAPVKTTTASSNSKKKSAKKKGQNAKSKKPEDDEIENLLAAIQSTTVSSKKSSKKKNKQATTTEDNENFREGEGQDLEDILKEIDEQFDETNRQKNAKKEKKKKKKEENAQKETEAGAKQVVEQVETKENISDEVKAATAEVSAEPTSEKADGDEDGASASTEKKTSSKSKKKAEEKKKKGGVDAKTLALMQEFQRKQQEAKLKAIEDEKEKIRALEELDKKREEQARLEKEQKEKKKLKEKQRIQRKKEEGTYLTKEQREKRQRALIQLEAAGVQVPTRQVPQKATTSEDQTGPTTKKRVVYDDRRKKGKNTGKQDNNGEQTNSSSQLTTTNLTLQQKSAENALQDLKDDWEQDSADEATNDNETITNSTSKSVVTTSEKDNQQVSSTSQKDTAASSESESDDETSSDESDETSSSSDDDEEEDPKLSPMERVRLRLERRHQKFESRRSTQVLRAPVICVLGHVDTGKTKILDNLRRSHVQDGEAGGITQQIGATNVPLETIRERTKMCRKLISREGDFLIPGLLIIDTPGHESFKNLRSRGSSLCDLAILVVDLMHGLEPQTLESIQLLKDRKTPFVIALNKIDRLYDWKGNSRENVQLVLEQQATNTKNEFEKRCNEIIVQFAEQSLNVALYYNNLDPDEFYSMIPTSAHSGDGMGSLIAMIIEQCQTKLAKRLSYSDELQATVMEVKAIGGLGTTIDITLVNGVLRVGDTIIVGGQEGPIVTQVRGLLMPEPNKELRVRNQYQNYKEVKAARGIKIAAKDLDKALAGLPLFVGRQEDEIEYYKQEIEHALKNALSSIKLKENGVYVQASTLGSLEALLEFLRTSNIPYSGINIGPVHRKDIMRASTQLERDAQWAVVLAFDVRIEKDAQDNADNLGVKIFHADIIYHLFDMFLAHRERLRKENQEKFRHVAVFPCKLRILPQYIFNSRDPIVCGVIIEDGFVRLGTPICVPSKECIELGRIVSIESNHKALEVARKGAEVCIKIESVSGDAPKMFGRHFDENDLLMSKITRESIDAVKDHFREDMSRSDWQLMVELKKIYNIL